MRSILKTLLLCASSMSASAADVVITRPTDLRADRYVDAAVLMPLTSGMHVDLLNLEAGWVQVRVDGRTGWVRATGLTGPGATVSALARLETGRGASGNIVVAAGIRGIPKASRHALIIGVDSSGGVPSRWPGVPYDVASARMIAERIGVPDGNVETVDGSDATIAGIDAAIDRLNERVQAGDQVLVYFSGPGTQVAANGACANAWSTIDGDAWTAAALVERLRPTLAHADKLMLISDAAYDRVPDDASASGRKFVITRSGCTAPPRDSLLPLIREASAAGFAAQNLVVLQSAPGPRQGLDVARAGGPFTQQLVDCFYGDAIDVDRSMSLSVEELASCVKQGRAGVRVAVDGNGRYSALAGLATNSNASAPAQNATSSPRAAIDDVYAQRDARIGVALIATPTTLQIGHDAFDLRLTSSRAGFVYLVLLGSDGTSFYLLFPNDLDRDNRIAAGETLRLPRPQWRVQSQGPAGHDTLLAIVAESERDLAPFAAHKEGPFSMALTDAAGRAQLQWLLGRSGRADSEACIVGGTRRNLAAVKVCSDAFGAALVDLIER